MMVTAIIRALDPRQLTETSSELAAGSGTCEWRAAKTEHSPYRKDH